MTQGCKKNICVLLLNNNNAATFPLINLTVKHLNSECRALASISLDSSARVTLFEEEDKTGTCLPRFSVGLGWVGNGQTAIYPLNLFVWTIDNLT